MTKREYVINALQHKETDHVPYYVPFTGSMVKKLMEFTGNPDFTDTIGDYVEWTNATDHSEPVEGKPGFIRDEFGVEVDAREQSGYVISKHVLPESTFDNYAFPGPVIPKIRANIEALLNNGKDTFKMVNVGVTLFERAWALRGMENLLVDMFEEEDFVIALLDKITEYNLAVMDISLEYEGFDAFYFGDDLGSQRGPIINPETWRKLYKPRLAKVYEHSKKHGKFNVLHACGDIGQLLPDMIEIGLDAYETFQPEIYDIPKIKREIGDKLSFFGGISAQYMLPFERPDKIIEIVQETLKIMGKDGGFVAAPTHTITDDVPPENVLAMLEVLQNQ